MHGARLLLCFLWRGMFFLLLVFFRHRARFNNFFRRAVTLNYILMIRFVLYVCFFFHGVAVVPRVSGARAPLLCSLACRGCDARGAAVTLFP